MNQHRKSRNECKISGMKIQTEETKKMVVVKNLFKKDSFVSVVEMLDDITGENPTPPSSNPSFVCSCPRDPVRNDVDVFSTSALTGLSTKGWFSLATESESES